MEDLGRNTSEGYSHPARARLQRRRRLRPAATPSPARLRRRLPRLRGRVGQPAASRFPVDGRRLHRQTRRRSRRPAGRGSSTTRSTSSSTSRSAATGPGPPTPPRRSRSGCSSTTSASTSDGRRHPMARGPWSPLRRDSASRIRSALAWTLHRPGRAGPTSAPDRSPTPPTLLLSQGRPATASSTENAGTAGRRRRRRQRRHPLVERRSADPQWIQVDLGATATIDQVVLNWEAAYARSFQIQVSANGTTWTTIYTTTTGTGGTQTLDVTGTGRYVRHVRHRPRHRRTATRCGSSRCSARSAAPAAAAPPTRPRAGRPPPRRSRTRHSGAAPPSTATPAPAGPAPFSRPAVDPGRPRRHARPSARSCWPGRPPTRARSRSRSPANGTTWTTIYSHHHRHRRHADARPSPAPAATCGCTAPPAPPPTATRCGSSRCRTAGGPRHADPDRRTDRRLLGRHEHHPARPERRHGQDSQPDQRPLPGQPGLLELQRPGPLDRRAAVLRHAGQHGRPDVLLPRLTQQPVLRLHRVHRRARRSSTATPPGSTRSALKLAMRLHAHDGYDVAGRRGPAPPSRRTGRSTFQRFINEVPAEFERAGADPGAVPDPRARQRPAFRAGRRNANYYTATRRRSASTRPTSDIFGCAGPLAEQPEHVRGAQPARRHLPQSQ